MYKSKLYELCQKRTWSLPDYNISRYGPDHDLRFCASVLVNGVQFNTEDLSRSSKEAQNKVSQVALEHFASVLPEPLPSSIGPRHALRFKAEVTVGERTFQGTTFFSTLKEAEHDAAKTALMLLTADETNNAKDDSVSYKTLLNDFAQKACISMPSYKTTSNGVDGFSSSVDAGNSSFFGDVAKSKKQAENNTAKVAWLKLNEGHGADYVSQDLEESPTTGNYSRARLDDKRNNDTKKECFRRLWPLEDEIKLLNSVLKFRLEKGKDVDPSTLELFCNFLKDKLSFTDKPKSSQVSEKIRALKNKYSENTVDCFTAEHDLKMKKIASQVWLVELRGNPRKRKYPLVEEEVQKLNIFCSNMELKFGEEAEALEEKLRKHKNLDTKQELKRKNIKKETMELILKGIGKLDCSVLAKMHGGVRAP